MGFEPTYGGFANLCLTTWLPRHETTRRPNGERTVSNALPLGQPLKSSTRIPRCHFAQI
jgi:hypothetical protein